MLYFEGAEAFVSYQDIDGVRVLDHSFVPPEFHSHKVGAELVHQTFEQLIADDIDTKTSCGYLVALAKRVPEWLRFLS